MLAKINTCVLQGLKGYLVEVETDISRGMPAFNIVGLPDTSIKESKERVRTAIKNSGFQFPLNRITINLAPADLKKEGSQLDLSIAVGILRATEVIKNSSLNDFAFIGELSLDGKITKINGALPIIISLREMGIKKVIVPYENKKECSVISDIDIIPVSNLYELVQFLNKEKEIYPYKTKTESFFDIDNENYEDFEDVKGQENIKRAMEVAAAGGHNILIIGPPGSGKTMLSRRLPSILPKLSFEESLEITKIYSISGNLSKNSLVTERPFRAPHHTISKVSLVGGGRIPKPGEVSLAHHGVLFLDELPEFSKSVLEVLRQPMEDGLVTISRVNATLSYPAKFMLVASMNPCPCGYYGDPIHECTCSFREISKYQNKISGPLLDRIDIHVEVMPVKYEDLESENLKSESSKEIRKRVNRARKIQLERYSKEEKNIYSNAQLGAKSINKYCKLDKECKELIKTAFDTLGLSARAYNKILKISRTIADLENSEQIKKHHLAEAIQFRSLDRKFNS
ncbi:YifB family Mg chelatase-like AAA ATPase [Thermohalobacter berrensis]|uniref:Magnesium chelatase n=1 Tax=Thermohalobacter berrensis TaxID=99594 RepID=A0A419TAD4_9FIRM|nr:YifB family Mg chelatase-like AAA ATPase [Thermohalobacter berrensis]RKD34422.1 magnesium chelatase [Thermohalobacter berrensis]